MILNINSIDVSLKRDWAPLAEKLDQLGYNINVDSGRKGAVVLHKESGDKVGDVSTEMIKDEEIDYILYSRLNLTKISG